MFYENIIKWQINLVINGDEVSIYSHHEIKNSDDNLDVFVKYKSKTYIGTIYTINSIEKYLVRNRDDSFFYDKSSIVVLELTSNNIIRAIKQIIKKNHLQEIFLKADA